jgi:thiamine biosynthesis lipoprotein
VHYLEHRFSAMGGACRLRGEHPSEDRLLSAFDAAQKEVRRLELKYSRYLADSLTSRINLAAGSGHPVEVDKETLGLLNYADTLWQQSDGLFDLTSGVLRRAWDFHAGEPPAPATLAELLPLVGWQHLLIEENAVTLQLAGMELDFGGLVKEYACDAAAGMLRKSGIVHGLVDLAGDMASTGPRADGQPWPVAVRRPSSGNQAAATVALDGNCIASSGDYERCLFIDGQRLGHILHPHTGWPVQGFTAVSVVAPQCLVAGSAATVAMLKPRKESVAWLQDMGLPWLAIDGDLNCFASGDFSDP